MASSSAFVASPGQRNGESLAGIAGELALLKVRGEVRSRGFGGEIARIIFLARLGPRLRYARTAFCGATGDISVALAGLVHEG